MEDVTVSVFTTPNLDDVDTSDVRSVVSSLVSSMGSIKDMRKDEIIKMFKLGVMLLGMDESGVEDKPSLRELGGFVNIDHWALLHAKLVAKQFNSDYDKFYQDYLEKGSPTWNTYVRKILKPSRRAYSSFGDSMRQKMDESLRTLADGNATEEMVIDLTKFRNKINKHIPLKSTLEDYQGIEYSFCACCGRDDIPPEGWGLVTNKKYTYIKYPICPECKLDEAEPKWEFIAKIYALQLIRVEELYAEASEIYS